MNPASFNHTASDNASYLVIYNRILPMVREDVPKTRFKTVKSLESEPTRRIDFTSEGGARHDGSDGASRAMDVPAKIGLRPEKQPPELCPEDFCYGVDPDRGLHRDFRRVANTEAVIYHVPTKIAFEIVYDPDQAILGGITIFGFAAHISEAHSAAGPPADADEIEAIGHDAIMAFLNHAAQSLGVPASQDRAQGSSKTDIREHRGLLAAAKLKRGRLRIPATFRQFLRGVDRVWISNFIINNRRCLVLYTPDEWGKYAARLARASPTDKDAALFHSFLIGGGAELLIDREGRVRLPLLLRKFVNHDPVLPPWTPRTVVLSRPDPRWML